MRLTSPARPRWPVRLLPESAADAPGSAAICGMDRPMDDCGSSGEVRRTEPLCCAGDAGGRAGACDFRGVDRAAGRPRGYCTSDARFPGVCGTAVAGADARLDGRARILAFARDGGGAACSNAPPRGVSLGLWLRKNREIYSSAPRNGSSCCGGNWSRLIAHLRACLSASSARRKVRSRCITLHT